MRLPRTNKQLLRDLTLEVQGLRRDLKGVSVVSIRDLTAAVQKELGKAPVSH